MDQKCWQLDLFKKYSSRSKKFNPEVMLMYYKKDDLSASTRPETWLRTGIGKFVGVIWEKTWQAPSPSNKRGSGNLQKNAKRGHGTWGSWIFSCLTGATGDVGTICGRGCTFLPVMENIFYSYYCICVILFQILVPGNSPWGRVKIHNTTWIWLA